MLGGGRLDWLNIRSYFRKKIPSPAVIAEWVGSSPGRTKLYHMHGYSIKDVRFVGYLREGSQIGPPQLTHVSKERGLSRAEARRVDGVSKLAITVPYTSDCGMGKLAICDSQPTFLIMAHGITDTWKLRHPAFAAFTVNVGIAPGAVTQLRSDVRNVVQALPLARALVTANASHSHRTIRLIDSLRESNADLGRRDADGTLNYGGSDTGSVNMIPAWVMPFTGVTASCAGICTIIMLRQLRNRWRWQRFCTGSSTHTKPPLQAATRMQVRSNMPVLPAKTSSVSASLALAPFAEP